MAPGSFATAAAASGPYLKNDRFSFEQMCHAVFITLHIILNSMIAKFS